jgi:hypothetical protein
MSSPSSRVNLAVPLDTMIQIEKYCEKRGISRIQFIKESIYEKLRNNNESQFHDEIKYLREDMNELRKIVLLLVDK